MASNFSVIPIRWLLTVDSEMAFFLFRSFAEGVLVFFSNSCVSRKSHCQTSEFQSKFHSKNHYRTHCFVIHAISVYSDEFSIEDIKENDLIIKAATEKIKRDRRLFESFYFHYPYRQ